MLSLRVTIVQQPAVQVAGGLHPESLTLCIMWVLCISHQGPCRGAAQSTTCPPSLPIVAVRLVFWCSRNDDPENQG
jgi:hypothetical protein